MPLSEVDAGVSTDIDGAEIVGVFVVPLMVSTNAVVEFPRVCEGRPLTSAAQHVDAAACILMHGVLPVATCAACVPNGMTSWGGCRAATGNGDFVVIADDDVVLILVWAEMILMI